MQKQLLIIDDDQELCEELTDILIDEGLTVITANDGIQGMERIQNSSNDLILLDLKLPGKNGIQILNEMDSKKNAQPVFIISGGFPGEDLPETLTDYPNVKQVLGKPLNIPELIQKIDITLNQSNNRDK
ncbi:MAG: response regulator [Spirochaetia bacterium]